MAYLLYRWSKSSCFYSRFPFTLTSWKLLSIGPCCTLAFSRCGESGCSQNAYKHMWFNVSFTYKVYISAQHDRIEMAFLEQFGEAMEIGYYSALLVCLNCIRTRMFSVERGRVPVDEFECLSERFSAHGQLGFGNKVGRSHHTWSGPARFNQHLDMKDLWYLK